MPHFVYMLRCAKDRIYTGYTTHCAGKGASFTRAFPPIAILKVFRLERKTEALSLEARIKRCSRAQKEEFVQLPEGTLPDIPKKPKKHKKQRRGMDCFACKQARNDGGKGSAMQRNGHRDGRTGSAKQRDGRRDGGAKPAKKKTGKGKKK